MANYEVRHLHSMHLHQTHVLVHEHRKLLNTFTTSCEGTYYNIFWLHKHVKDGDLGTPKSRK